MYTIRLFFLKLSSILYEDLVYIHHDDLRFVILRRALLVPGTGINTVLQYYSRDYYYLFFFIFFYFLLL